MKRFLLAVFTAGVLLAVAGCSGGTGAPKAVVPEDQVNFGDVPVVTDMSKALTQEFTIKNEGTGPLKLSNLQVKVLEGC